MLICRSDLSQSNIEQLQDIRASLRRTIDDQEHCLFIISKTKLTVTSNIKDNTINGPEWNPRC